jgi:hypothetical protein
VACVKFVELGDLFVARLVRRVDTPKSRARLAAPALNIGVA